MIFVSANPRALILIASTFTGIEISHQIFIVLFGLSRKFSYYFLNLLNLFVNSITVIMRTVLTICKKLPLNSFIV